ncbi:MAG: hypothetical protein JSV44_11545 [Candidatus Zixiibacteriota bacterium]|nr:MAG: hypothetical protein JSV44_11545 [candidate division Zixibacteria bacterium]
MGKIIGVIIIMVLALTYLNWHGVGLVGSLISGIFGLVAGLFGAVIGVAAGLFGAVFGVGIAFISIFFPLAVLILIIAAVAFLVKLI